MDNYVLRLSPEAARKLIDALRIKFNSPVRYKGKFYSWDTLIRLKAQELTNYIIAWRIELDFDGPRPSLDKSDSESVRNQILSLTSAEAKKRGIGRNTLWHLKTRARTGKPFEVCLPTIGKLRKRL